jgi:hypothetical protein
MYRFIFFISAPVGGKWSASNSGRFTLGEGACGTHLIGGWVGPNADVDDVGKRKFLTLPEFELQTLGRPAPNQSLYRLRYPGSLPLHIHIYICFNYYILGPSWKTLSAGGPLRNEVFYHSFRAKTR